MKGRVLAVLLVAVLCARPTLAEQGVSAELVRVQRLLAEEQIDEAVTAIEPLLRTMPDVAPVQVLAGTLKFYQGDYRGAVHWLERGLGAYDSAHGEASELLAIARGALDVTESYVVRETEHFIIRTPPGRDRLLAPYAAEALERAYERLGRIFDHHPHRMIVVDFLPSPRDLARMSPLSEEAITTSGTVALSKYGRLLVTSPKALMHGYPWLDTLAHEYIHLLVTEKTRNNVPVWLHEGLAKYYESTWRGEPGLALDPGSERLLAESVRANKLITFAQMHPSMALLPTQHDTSLAFAEVFTVVEYLRSQHGDDVVARLLDSIARGVDEEQAIAQVSGGSFSQFEKTWRRYLKKRPYKIIPGAEPRVLTFKQRGDRDDLDMDLVTKLPAGAERRRRLGGILRAAGRPKAASIEYQRALDRAGAQAPRLYNVLAATALEAGELERARTTLEAAVLALPDDPQTQILSGRVAFAQQRYADARRSFELANRVHPFHPEIHSSLVAIAQKLDDKALLERERAALRALYRDLSPTSPSLLARQGDPETAELRVTTRPFARLIIDDQELGLWTPVEGLWLRAGPHRLRFFNPALGVDVRQKIELRAGETRQIDRALATGPRGAAAGTRPAPPGAPSKE